MRELKRAFLENHLGIFYLSHSSIIYCGTDRCRRYFLTAYSTCLTVNFCPFFSRNASIYLQIFRAYLHISETGTYTEEIHQHYEKKFRIKLYVTDSKAFGTVSRTLPTYSLVLPSVSFACPPKHFNKIEFAVKPREAFN